MHSGCGSQVGEFLTLNGLAQTAFAFGGYNVTNRGRTPELLAHPAYGPSVAAHLREASQIYAEVLQQPVDLVARMREGKESRGVIDHVEDVAVIVAVQMAQLRLLEEFHGIP
jgi:[acyl-carrier-protein] S-malonyltransferase